MLILGATRPPTRPPVVVPTVTSTTSLPRTWIVCKLDAITTLRGEVFAFKGSVRRFILVAVVLIVLAVGLSLTDCGAIGSRGSTEPPPLINVPGTRIALIHSPF